MLQSESSRQKGFVQSVQDDVVKHNFSQAIDAAKVKGGMVAGLLVEGLNSFTAEGQVNEEKVQAKYIEYSQKLDRFHTMILVVAAVAPLLGLLGTVTGMISTFDVITEFGTGDPKLLSGGISEALVTTEMGLIVAIPSVFLGQLLGSWSDQVKSELEKVALLLGELSKGNNA